MTTIFDQIKQAQDKDEVKEIVDEWLDSDPTNEIVYVLVDSIERLKQVMGTFDVLEKVKNNLSYLSSYEVNPQLIYMLESVLNSLTVNLNSDLSKLLTMLSELKTAVEYRGNRLEDLAQDRNYTAILKELGDDSTIDL